jgi:CMP-N-acetylneuraminic acid synthetase
MENTRLSSLPKIIALVPMRHLSERIPGKNYRLFAGKPLYHYIINTLLGSPYISMIVIDTDSKIIRDDVANNFPQVITIDRPPHLTAGTVSMNDILLHDVRQFKADYYLQTHSTNPLIRPETVTKALRTFLAGYPAYDSLFSVTRLQVRLWDQLGRAINHNPAVLLQTQDLPPVYEENSCLYIFTRQKLLEHRNRLGERPLMFEIDPAEAWDIDDEIDFLIADLLKRQSEGVAP